jgi:hypothetical protein
VSRLSRICRSLDVSRPYGLPWLVTGIALPFFFKTGFVFLHFILSHRYYILTSEGRVHIRDVATAVKRRMLEAAAPVTQILERERQ